MAFSSKEQALLCFKNTSEAIMAEQSLSKGECMVQVMPAPSALKKDCGFCLRFSSQHLSQVVAVLLAHNIALSNTSAYIRKESSNTISYHPITL